MFDKGSLVWAVCPPIKGAGWPGPEVLGVVYTIAKEGIWVQFPGGPICLFSPVTLTSAD